MERNRPEERKREKRSRRKWTGKNKRRRAKKERKQERTCSFFNRKARVRSKNGVVRYHTLTLSYNLAQQFGLRKLPCKSAKNDVCQPFFHIFIIYLSFIETRVSWLSKLGYTILSWDSHTIELDVFMPKVIWLTDVMMKKKSRNSGAWTSRRRHMRHWSDRNTGNKCSVQVENRYIGILCAFKRGSIVLQHVQWHTSRSSRKWVTLVMIWFCTTPALSKNDITHVTPRGRGTSSVSITVFQLQVSSWEVQRSLLVSERLGRNPSHVCSTGALCLATLTPTGI